ncbi:MAG: 1-aminocyclopropane-1-carboxylate deaminase/D-cysteine desulfhydrase [Flavobacteriaceae bacterium]|nr:1-aminocyclopropane-1-carboxylate deaminase/D-cysteine desulfhydrase [Flavobacteriaceae bacterium]
MLFSEKYSAEIQSIDLKSWFKTNISLDILREDQVHPKVSGNKFRKLKYNIKEAIRLKQTPIITFGGAYSNHIAAVAAAGNIYNIPTVGIIRGEELIKTYLENPTLNYAVSQGMKLEFISREQYTLKNSETFHKRLKERYTNPFIIPEGGTNALAVKGCAEILDTIDSSYDYIMVSVGTGGTMAGIIEASASEQEVVGYSALKGTFQISEIEKYTVKRNYRITDEYSFGGYAKIDAELVRFINEFKINTGIPLDPVYTGKMLYGIMDDLKKNKFRENTRILAIHTGGLQGINGMNTILKKKNLPQII